MFRRTPVKSIVDYFQTQNQKIDNTINTNTNTHTNTNTNRHTNTNTHTNTKMEIFSLSNEMLNVYTDGSCINNGKANAKAGIGVYFGENDQRNVSERVIGKKQTNNTGELQAIIKVFQILHKEIITEKQRIDIYTDSEYAIKCATSYGYKIYNSNSDKPIPNKDLVVTIYRLFKENKNAKLHHVKAHTSNVDVHSIGNCEADRLANEAVNNSEQKHKSKANPHFRLTFGKYEHMTLEQINKIDNHYLQWCSKKLKNNTIRLEIKKYLQSI